MNMRPCKRLAFSLCLLLAGIPGLGAQTLRYDVTQSALGSFRLGVAAYHRGRYPEAIRAFEKSLSEGGASGLCKYWLGLAYYKNGFPSVALDQWATLGDEGALPPFVQNRMERIRASGIPPMGDPSWLRAASLPGVQRDATIFLRPSALVVLGAGRTLVVSHGSNEVVILDANGTVLKRFKGPLGGFDRPYDAAPLPDGSIALTEFGGDRVSILDANGNVTRRFGTKGRGQGQFLGPSNLSYDSGYLYIVDYGNVRVCKYDLAGTFVSSFGAVAAGFPGLKDPTGICSYGGLVYVSDKARGTICVFDASGNYLYALGTGELESPEDIEARGPFLYVACTRTVRIVDLETQTVIDAYKAETATARILDVYPAENGTILFCDFDSSTVGILDDASAAYGGIDVEIVSVDASLFPVVSVDVAVRTKDGLPLSGLDRRNFLLTEAISESRVETETGGSYVVTTESFVAAKDQKLAGSGDAGGSYEAVVVVEGSTMLAADLASARKAVDDLFKAFGSYAPKAIFAAGMPVDMSDPTLPGTLAALDRNARSAGIRDEYAVDTAIRLAIASMNATSPRKSIVFVCSGRETGAFMARSTLDEMASFMNANDVSFNVVTLVDGPLPDGIEYLRRETGGALSYYLAPSGLGTFVDAMAAAGSGRYRLTFVSRAQPVTGSEYFRIAVEAYMYARSGKDESGYFTTVK